jgi:hypothetical protein
MTQEAFAKLLDTPVGTVRGWEQGWRQPPPSAKGLNKGGREVSRAGFGMRGLWGDRRSDNPVALLE